MYLCCSIHHHLGLKRETEIGRVIDRREDEEEGQENGVVSAPQIHQHHGHTKL